MEKETLLIIIEKYKKSDSILKANQKSIEESLSYYKNYGYEEWKKEYPRCDYTFEYLKFCLKLIKMYRKELKG